MCRGTDFPRLRNRGKAYLKRNSRFSAKILLIISKKHTLLSKRTFQLHFENRNGQYLCVCVCDGKLNSETGKSETENQCLYMCNGFIILLGVKPFKCAQCSYATVERSHLKVHIRIHTGDWRWGILVWCWLVVTVLVWCWLVVTVFVWCWLVVTVRLVLTSCYSPCLVFSCYSPCLVLTSCYCPCLVFSCYSPCLVLTSCYSPCLVLTSCYSPCLVLTSCYSPWLVLTSCYSSCLVLTSCNSPCLVLTSCYRPCLGVD